MAALPYPAYGFAAIAYCDTPYCRIAALPYPAYGFTAIACCDTPL